MNRLGKLIFVVTALAPCAWAFAIYLYSQGETFNATCWLIAGLGLFAVCWLVIEGAKRFHQRQPLTTKKVKLADKEVLAFLLAYLLPLASAAHIEFKGNLLTAAYVYAVIGVCVFHSNAFTFNPLLAILGYHFYEVEGECGITYLLVCRRCLQVSESTLTVIQFGDYIFVETGA